MPAAAAPATERRRHSEDGGVKKYFITGLLIWIPLVITFMVMAWIISSLDQILLLLPNGMHPREVLGFNVPGAGVLFSLLIVFATGLVAANVIGQKLVQLWEAILARIAPPAIAVRFRVDEIFVQTPGPAAGRRLFPPEP